MSPEPLKVSCWLLRERSGEEVPVKGVFFEKWTQEYFQILILRNLPFSIKKWSAALIQFSRALGCMMKRGYGRHDVT